MIELDIQRLAPGLGIGEGPISAQQIERLVGSTILRKVDAAIHSPDILVAIDTDDYGRLIDDDGCGDGRRVARVTRAGKQLHRSLNRAKVFGGGATMALADLIGSGRSEDLSLEEAYDAAITQLRAHHIDFGAHTADSAPAGSCGCGAIDQAPRALSFIEKYEQQIRGQLRTLGISDDGLDGIFKEYQAYAQAIAGQPYSGERVAQRIMHAGKVIKELAGPHIETHIILNFVEGMTINQAAVREASEGAIDVFGVDVWRMTYLAHSLHPDDMGAQDTAFKSMLVYTLSTAAVLTSGDLPVYAVRPLHSAIVAPQDA